MNGYKHPLEVINREKLVGIIGKHVDYHTAEDIVSEGIIRAYEKFTQFDRKKSSLFTWVYTICRNILVDKQRLHKSHLPRGRNRLYASSDIEVMGREEWRTPEHINPVFRTVLTEVELQNIYEILPTLNSSKQQMFKDFVSVGFESCEYAKIHHITPVAARQRLSNLRKDIKQRLKGNELLETYC